MGTDAAANEDLVYEALLLIVKQETEALLTKAKRDWVDLQKLEKVAKVYCQLKDDLRGDVKDDIKRPSAVA
jgi:hypothetical protein